MAWVDFKDIRARISLADVLFRYYQIESLTQKGDKLYGPCPVHGGDSPRAFQADLSKNIWHCFTKCQGGGNQLDLVAKKDGVSIREAALRLKSFFLSDAEAPTPNEPTPPFNTSTKGNQPILVSLHLDHDHPHLTEQRGLSVSTCEHFGVGYCRRGIMRSTIAIPIHNHRAELIAYAGRRLKPKEARQFGKYKLPKGFKKDLVLFNLHRVSPTADEGLIIVEGFFSVMRLFEAGITNVVATMGADISAAQAAMLGETPRLILMFDGDAAGREAAKRAVSKLTPTHLQVVHLPEGTDPDELELDQLTAIMSALRSFPACDLSLTLREGGS